MSVFECMGEWTGNQLLQLSCTPWLNSNLSYSNQWIWIWSKWAREASDKSTKRGSGTHGRVNKIGHKKLDLGLWYGDNVIMNECEWHSPQLGRGEVCLLNTRVLIRAIYSMNTIHTFRHTFAHTASSSIKVLVYLAGLKLKSIQCTLKVWIAMQINCLINWSTRTHKFNTCQNIEEGPKQMFDRTL